MAEGVARVWRTAEVQLDDDSVGGEFFAERNGSLVGHALVAEVHLHLSARQLGHGLMGGDHVLRAPPAPLAAHCAGCARLEAQPYYGYY